MRPLNPMLPLATIAMGCGGFSLGQHVGWRVVQVKVSPGGVLTTVDQQDLMWRR